MDGLYEIMVCIHCMTYNHEKYLADALEGFVMQKTDFPFVAVVIDDCSTDGTADVLRKYEEKYPEIIKAVYLKENYYSQHKSKQPFLEPWDSRAKYIALCEGDDYWTDPLKLQKQVDILEAKGNLMAVVTNSTIVDQNGILLKERMDDVVKGNEERTYNLREFFHTTHHYPTATVCYRNSHPEEVQRLKVKTANPFFGDWTLWIILHSFGDFYYLDEVTSAYRINPTSVTHANVDERRLGLAKANFGIIKSVQDILPEEYSDIKKELGNKAWMWFNLANAYKHSQKYILMFYALCRCTVCQPNFIMKEYAHRNRIQSRKQTI